MSKTRLNSVRLVVRVVGVVLSGLLLFALLGVPLYVLPPNGSGAEADLIYVLGPPSPGRLKMAEELHEGGDGRSILISVNPSGQQLSATDLPMCMERGVTCEIPDPLKTRGEAAMLTDYAKTHTIHKTVILTFTPQVMRARFIFAKCYKGDFSVVAVDEHLRLRDWAYQYLYQTAGFLKAFVKPCPQ